MGDVDKSDTQFLVQLLQLNLHVVAHLEIEGAERLVQQEHFRLVDNRTCNRYTLLLATGEGVHFALLITREVSHLKRLTHFLLDGLRVFFLELQTKSNVVENVQVGE